MSGARTELTGILLAVLLGAFGAHHFYLRRWTPGIVYLLISMTGVLAPVAAVAGALEAFWMPARVRRFNAARERR